MFFYDWEANVLTPEGKTVAPLLPGQDLVASRISQAAGDPGQGMAFYNAALLGLETESGRKRRGCFAARTRLLPVRQKPSVPRRS